MTCCYDGHWHRLQHHISTRSGQDFFCIAGIVPLYCTNIIRWFMLYIVPRLPLLCCAELSLGKIRQGMGLLRGLYKTLFSSTTKHLISYHSTTPCQLTKMYLLIPTQIATQHCNTSNHHCQPLRIAPSIISTTETKIITAVLLLMSHLLLVCLISGIGLSILLAMATFLS